MSSLLSDVRFAFRTLVRQPAFTLMAVGMLALGIAGATSIFSVFNGLFLRPLPFAEPERLVDLDETAPKWGLEYVSINHTDFDAWRSRNQTFDGMAAWEEQGFNLASAVATERVEGARVTHDLTRVLRLTPLLGRTFTAAEDSLNGPKVVLLGHALWQRRFASRADVLNQVLRLNDEPYTIVGVLPPEARFPGRAELWVPLAVDPQVQGAWYLNGIGRLKPGVTVAQARDDLARVHRSMPPTQGVKDITSPVVQPVRDRYVSDYDLVTRVLLAAVAVVLLIACVNIAGLMLVRGTGRSREMGIRAALGASRARMLRQALTESLLLASVGGLLGAVLGALGLNALLSVIPDQLPAWVRFDLDARFLAFSMLVSALAAICFGLGPALAASRVDVQRALQGSGRTSASPATRRSLNAFVVGELALAAALLVGAGLLVQAFRYVQRTDPGFDPEGVLTYRVALAKEAYGKAEPRIQFIERLVEQTRALPGVRAVGAVSATPLGGHSGYFFETEQAPRGSDDADPVILQRIATPGYLEAIGITLRAGRSFTQQDGLREQNQVAIVNETFARRFFPGGQALGKRLRHRGATYWMTVIGVVADVKDYGLDREVRPSVYINHRRMPLDPTTIVVRSAGDPLALVAPSRELLRRLDPGLPMFAVTTMTERLRESMWIRRTSSWLVAVFAGVAMLLALAGIYGVLSYTVSQRTREIGIRMALGAARGRVVRDVLAAGMRLVAIGSVAGLAGGYLGARVLQSLLVGVGPTAWTTYAGVAIIVIALALLAHLLPARRAAGVDPVRALRVE